MADLTNEVQDTSPWLSTYGMLTAERILEGFHLSFPQEKLSYVLSQRKSIFNQILSVPLLHVLNGIIMQQAHDYEVYLQKLFIDYLLSGESGKSEESPGANSRHDLEELRIDTMSFAENFHRQELAHEKLIADSQAVLIKEMRAWRASLVKAADMLSEEYLLGDDAIESDWYHGMLSALTMLDTENDILHQKSFWNNLTQSLHISFNETQKTHIASILDPLVVDIHRILEKMQTFEYQARVMNEAFRTYRTTFYQYILKSIELFNSLSEYRMNNARDDVNREPLYFDKTIGDESVK